MKYIILHRPPLEVENRGATAHVGGAPPTLEASDGVFAGRIAGEACGTAELLRIRLSCAERAPREHAEHSRGRVHRPPLGPPLTRAAYIFSLSV